MEETRVFCAERQVDLAAIQAAAGYQRIALLDDAVDAMLASDDIKRRYLALAGAVDRLFKAMLPDPKADLYGPTRKAIVVLAEKIRSQSPDVDISSLMAQVDGLLDRSVAAEPYVIAKPPPDILFLGDVGEAEAEYVDLSKIDFDALARQFRDSHQHTQAEKLRGAINAKLQRLVRLNKSRIDYLERFQQLIDAYNAGAASVDMFFANLVAFARELNAEEQRHMAEKLSEEELAVLDLLTAPTLTLTKDEREAVKQIARELLETLKREQKLVLDWRKYQRTRADVRLTIEQVLDRLPQRYSQQYYQVACDSVYQHIYDKYYGAGRSVYALAA
jgi:type I restriction enzyme R subunit